MSDAGKMHDIDKCYFNTTYKQLLEDRMGHIEDTLKAQVESMNKQAVDNGVLKEKTSNIEDIVKDLRDTIPTISMQQQETGVKLANSWKAVMFVVGVLAMLGAWAGTLNIGECLSQPQSKVETVSKVKPAGN